MKTKAVRLYGKNDLRLEEFELPEIGRDEILAKIVSDSICMSTHKAAELGPDHKRVPSNCATHPTIVGHEFCGEIVQVGEKWQNDFKVGQRFGVQPALNYKPKENGLGAPGYSYEYIGGNATYVVIPNEVMECGCLITHESDAYFKVSLSEPMSCIIAGFHENYHSDYANHAHIMGIKEGGAAAILAGVGPMGLGCIDYAIHCDRRPSLLVVTDIDSARIERAKTILTPEEAERNGVKLVYVNTSEVEDPVEYIKSLNGGRGYDDVFVYAPVAALVEQGDALLATDGCLNFFAGPTDSGFKAKFNFFDVHYSFHRITGTSGGNTNDMVEAIKLISDGKINPAMMITHVGGLDSAIDTTLNLPSIKGGKKLVYTHISMPMTAISDFAELGKTDKMFADLAEICERNNGIWSTEAEKYLLANAKRI
ncbi:MAG: L-sorbose 1-phosphate reductase [Ruminococcaceae bacterium]|nr:L-sorbose 1-phosphate reductase [Oscillospiraceae bacterium]